MTMTRHLIIRAENAEAQRLFSSSFEDTILDLPVEAFTNKNLMRLMLETAGKTEGVSWYLLPAHIDSDGAVETIFEFKIMDKEEATYTHLEPLDNDLPENLVSSFALRN